MTDPQRLLEGGSDLERELLGSLADERPTPTLSLRMRQGLIALGVLTSAKTGVAGIVALASVVSVGAGAAWIATHEPAPVRHLSTVNAPAVARVVQSAVRESVPAPRVEPPPPPAAPSVAPRVAPLPSAAGDLREQISLLDRARAAVRARNSQLALEELAAYRRQFPRGEFSQEVTVLKVEALAQAGQMDAARALGKKFLAAHPESPHVERIERMIGR